MCGAAVISSSAETQTVAMKACGGRAALKTDEYFHSCYTFPAKNKESTLAGARTFLTLKRKIS
jgi:hypothetical protein